MRAFLVWAPGLLALAAMSCSHSGGLESKTAIQAAIEAHLKSRSNLILSRMTLEVEGVKFDGNRAEAGIVYRSKQSPELAVRVRYKLRQAGDHWEVESSSPLGGMAGDPHTASPARIPADSAAPASAHSSELPAPQPSH